MQRKKEKIERDKTQNQQIFVLKKKSKSCFNHFNQNSLKQNLKNKIVY
jgi:hypothetical protein